MSITDQAAIAAGASLLQVIGEPVFTEEELRAAVAGAKKKPLSNRTIRRYEDEPDGLPFIFVGGRKYYRVSAVREWILRRERRRNPRRVA